MSFSSYHKCLDFFFFFTLTRVLDGARVDWGDQCRPPDGVATIHVRPGLKGPLRDVQPELPAVHWWSEAADAPAAGGGVQPGFRRPVHIGKALSPPPPTSWSLQPCTAAPPLRWHGDQRPGHDELRARRLAVGAVVQRRRVSVQPAKTSKWDFEKPALSWVTAALNRTLSAFCYLSKGLSLHPAPWDRHGFPSAFTTSHWTSSRDRFKTVMTKKTCTRTVEMRAGIDK